jgi:hypothetical protein
MKPILEKFEPTSMDAILKVYFSKNGVVIDIERTNFFPFHVMQSPHKVLSAAGQSHSFSELLAKTSLGNINTPVPPLDSLAAYYGINSTPPAGVVPQMVPMLPFSEYSTSAHCQNVPMALSSPCNTPRRLCSRAAISLLEYYSAAASPFALRRVLC